MSNDGPHNNLIGTLLLAVLVFVGANCMATQVRCVAEFGGKASTLIAEPVDDVYRFVIDDALAPFRVSVQYLKARGKLKMYAYHDSKDRFVLIHAAEFSFNDANCAHYTQGFGLNRIYSAKMEKELLFQCFAECY